MLPNGSARTSHRICIDVPQDKSVQLVGTLERWESLESNSQPKQIALILHGAMGHKDYLFLKKLAHSLPIDSLRFDFRGNHESTGPPLSVANLEDDIEDLNAVASHLVGKLGYRIAFVIGHSRGSVMGLKWVCTAPEGRGVKAFVNVSGRYRMKKILEIKEGLMPFFQRDGYHDRQAIVARKPTVVRSYPEDYDKFASEDTSFVWTDCPPQLDVLTIHGLKDEVVPVYDSLIWTDALSQRSPGTHTLHLIEGGDHNLTKWTDEVVTVILEWSARQQNHTLTSGIWKTSYRPRL